MHENLLKTVTNLGAPKVLVVGDFMLDIYTYGDAERISPEAPVPILKVRKTERNCGGAASVANDLAALGAVPVCIGIVGDDQNAQILKQKLAEVGADISGLLTVTDRPTITKQRLIGLAQHRHQQQLFRLDEESTLPLSAEQYEKILSVYENKLHEADIVCLQDYNKALLAPSLCCQMIALAKQNRRKVLVDPAYINDYSKYSGATVITPNRQETSMVVGFGIGDGEAAAKAADNLLNKLNLEAVVITLDRDGAFLKTRQQAEIVPTRPRTVYDVTGAGDVVLAAIAVSLAAGCDYKTAVQLANLAGGIEVEKFGVATVTIDEIINEIVAERRGKGGKIRTLDSLLEELGWHKRQKETIVFTNGCFDVVHRGHIEFLKFCKEHGDILVVGLNSDSSVRTIKGADRPINNQHDRAAVLAALETVDYVTIFDEPDPLSLISKVKPDVLVKGKDWEHKGIVGADFVKSYGGKVVLAPLVEGKSSTTIIEKIKSVAAKIKKAGTPARKNGQ
jgi:D-beta-D-heptose 7-phosphate kinase/D-beta-D-heptose 1-phosphate adenosyltransferase